jgi:hypothetical protein
MGMATGLHMVDVIIFVGSLRKTGYRGHIILGVDEDVDEEVLNYFKLRNVTPVFIKYSPLYLRALLQNKGRARG